MIAAAHRWGMAMVAVVGLALLSLSLGAAIATAKPRHTLAAGKELRSGQALVAGSARLTMRANGDLVLLYVPLRARSPLAERARPPRPGCDTRRCHFLRPRRLWHAETGGHPGARLTMRADGAAVVRAGGRVLWSSRTTRRGAVLRLGRDGDLGVYAPRSSGGARASSLEAELEALWRTGTETPEYVGSELAAGEQLGPNQYLQSANGQYELDMTPQGWLALWVRGAGPCPMFIAPEGGDAPYPPKQPGSTLEMEAGGVLTIRSPEPGNPLTWWMLDYDNPHERKQPTPVPGSRLVLEADGNLAVVAPDGTVVWETETDRIRGPVLCPGESLWYGQLLGRVTAGPGSQYQAGYYVQIATANRGRGSELDVVGACKLCVSHVYRSKTGASATGMYLQMQSGGNLQLLLDAAGSSPVWETGTTFPNSFATVSGFGSLQLYAPLTDSEGERRYFAIYENPNVEEELSEGISQSEKLSMTLAPMG